MRDYKVVRSCLWGGVDQRTNGGSDFSIRAGWVGHPRCAAGAAVGKIADGHGLFAGDKRGSLDCSIQVAAVNLTHRDAECLDGFTRLPLHLSGPFTEMSL